MINAILHLVVLSVFIGLFSMFGTNNYWIWLPAISSITISIHLLVINFFYFKKVMENLLNIYSSLFNDPEEIEMMKTSPGIFLPPTILFTEFAKLDVGASTGWITMLSTIGFILGIIFNYFVALVCGIFFVIYLFSGINSMFYTGNQDSDMFCCLKRYLAKKKINIKSMSNNEIEYITEKYERIVIKLKKISKENLENTVFSKLLQK